MKVSVVIPVYNGADFIQKSYQSILNQQLSDFEIIYVDNNSTDGSLEEILKLKQQDHRVILEIQEKQGAAPARNLGIQKSSGDYIYVFDVDDEIYPNALKTMMEVLDTHMSAEAVFGKMVKSKSGDRKTPKPQNESFKVIFKEKPYWGLVWFSDLKKVVGPPAFMYRASVFKRIGAYNEELRLGQDTAFDIKLGLLCNIAFLDMYVYIYLKHDTSTTQIVKKKTPRAFMVWPRLVKEHLPFYLNNTVPLRFKTLLFAQVYQSMGRQLLFTQGVVNRQRLKQQLLSDISAIRVSWIIRFYLTILVLAPLEWLGKVYRYYIVPHVIKKLKK